MNAVEAVAEYMEYQNPPAGILHWHSYCPPPVEQHFGAVSIAGTADSSSSTAALIAEDRFIDNVIFLRQPAQG